MSRYHHHQTAPSASLPPRKSSTPWDRLRPAKQDVLEAMGFVSKGDNRLRDVKTQEAFFNTIVNRYMQFCAHHKSNLDAAFASLLKDDDNATVIRSELPTVKRESSKNESGTTKTLSTSKWATPSTAATAHPSPTPSPPPPPPEQELALIFTALRKLREGLLSTSSTASSPVFSQRVHVFNIRAAILAKQPLSYHPSLLYLLSTLHTSRHPLPLPELKEMTTYMILDLALRSRRGRSDENNDEDNEGDEGLVTAYTLRSTSKKLFGYKDSAVDKILHSVTTNNWVVFWRVYRQVDGYVRALMHWHIDRQRKQVLKVFGKAYLRVGLDWVLWSVNEREWEELVRKEKVGWAREGDVVVVRKPKPKPTS